jgi:RNA polymerase sigma-70 factor (ECF subfamily)
MANPSGRDVPSAPHDEVVAHARFVRALAGELARDDGEADELAARVMAEAIARRPEAGPGLRVWLHTVVQRLFLRARRDDERRGRRERAAARPASPPATVDLVAEMELQRAIGDAFEELEEPLKSTLFRRYFHDETPTRIAQETAVPLATVKSRLQRGLQRLRARLDERQHGGREAWCAVAIGLAGRGVPLAKASSLVGSAVAAALIVGVAL